MKVLHKILKNLYKVPAFRADKKRIEGGKTVKGDTPITTLELPGYTVVVPNQVYQQETQLPAEFQRKNPEYAGLARRVVVLARMRVPTQEEAFQTLGGVAQVLADGKAQPETPYQHTLEILRTLPFDAVKALAEQDPKALAHLREDHYQRSDVVEGQSYLQIAGALFPDEVIGDMDKEMREAILEMQMLTQQGQYAPSVADMYHSAIKQALDYTEIAVRLQEGRFFPAREELEHLLVREVRDSFDLSVLCAKTRKAYEETAVAYARPLAAPFTTPEAVALVRDTTTSVTDGLLATIIQSASGCLTAMYETAPRRGGNRTAAMLAQLFGGNLPEGVKIMGVGPEGEIVNLKDNILGENLGEGNELDDNCVGVVDEDDSRGIFDEYSFHDDDLFGAKGPDRWPLQGKASQSNYGTGTNASKPEASDAPKPHGRKSSRRRRR